MDNKIIKIDFENLTEVELERVQQEISLQKQKILDKRVREIENWRKQKDAEDKIKDEKLNEAEEKISVLMDENKDIKSKINTIEFADDGSMEALTKACKQRILNLLGGEIGSPQYIILYRHCLADLQGKIKKDLGGKNKLGKIHIDDFQVAMTLARRYTLNRARITKKIEELERKQSNGTLSPEMSKALDLTIEWKEARGM